MTCLNRTVNQKNYVLGSGKARTEEKRRKITIFSRVLRREAYASASIIVLSDTLSDGKKPDTSWQKGPRNI